MDTSTTKIAGLVAAVVIFIIVIAIVLWFSKETMGEHYAHLLWSGYASVVLLSLGLGITMAVGMIGWM